MAVRIDTTKLLDVTDRKKWRAWLARHYKSETEVWLVFYKKHTGKKRIAYNDAVEEALCYGWIDSQVKSLDEDRFAQRFSPRKPKTPYSQANKERLRNLLRQGKVVGDVAASLGDIQDDAFAVPRDILAAIKSNKDAGSHFQEFSKSYVRIRIGFIEGARAS